MVSSELLIERMCVACRKRQAATPMLRFVKSPAGDILFDVKGEVEARSAFVCADPNCLQNALKKRALQRSLSGTMDGSTASLDVEIKAAIKKRALTNLSLAFRMRNCVAGRTKVRDVASSGQLVALLIASDIAENSLECVQEITAATGTSIPTFGGVTKAEIGITLGLSETGIVGLLKGRITDHVITDLWRFGRLNGSKE